MSATSENELLRLCARRFLGTAKDSDLQQAVTRALDWPQVLELASRQGMVGIVAETLSPTPPNKEDRPPLAPFLARWRRIFLHNGRLLAELRALDAAFSKKGLRALVLKGGALLTTVYGRRIGLRPLSDIDLLVGDDDMEGARQILGSRGFRPAADTSFYSRGEIVVDLHRDLVGAARVPRRARAARFDSSDLWRKAVPLGSSGGALWALSPEYQFLHLAVHGQKHSYARLIWLVDLGLVARTVDKRKLFELAEKTGTCRTLAYVLDILERLLGIPADPEMRTRLPRPSRLERVFLDRVVAQTPMDAMGEVLVTLSLPSFRDQIAYLWEYAFPRTGLGPGWRGLGIPRRLGRLFRGAFGELARVLR